MCFYANIFRWETCLSIKWKDVTAITKEKTARVIPNAILICTTNEKYFITSFASRDKAYLMLFRVWQNALMDKPMQPQEMWQWVSVRAECVSVFVNWWIWVDHKKNFFVVEQKVHNCYGDELGLTSDDEDYIDPYENRDDETLPMGQPKITDSEVRWDIDFVQIHVANFLIFFFKFFPWRSTRNRIRTVSSRRRCPICAAPQSTTKSMIPKWTIAKCSTNLPAT